jgi:hypothetical protein
MKAVPLSVTGIVGSVLIGLASSVALAQTGVQPPAAAASAPTREPVQAAPEPPTIEPSQEDLRFDRHSWGPVIRVGSDYVLRNGESVDGVVVISSSATIEGHVRGDMAVVFGTTRLTRTAVIDGSLIVTGGNAAVESGALVRDGLVVVGGALEAPPDFAPGREHVVIGGNRLAERVRRVVPWITEGLLLGRPIVPTLGWIWGIVFVVFLVSLALNLIFLGAVTACAEALAAKPLSTFLVGLLVLLMTGPVSVVLAASVVGLAVVPFVLCALVIAWIIGKVGVTLWIGGSLVGQPSPATRLLAVRSFVIGFAAICLAYMVPVLGFVVWSLSGVLGLGAATFAFMAAFRRENPAPPKPAALSPVVVPPSLVDDAPPPSSPALSDTAAGGGHTHDPHRVPQGRISRAYCGVRARHCARRHCQRPDRSQ